MGSRTLLRHCCWWVCDQLSRERLEAEDEEAAGEAGEAGEGRQTAAAARRCRGRSRWLPAGWPDRSSSWIWGHVWLEAGQRYSRRCCLGIASTSWCHCRSRTMHPRVSEEWGQSSDQPSGEIWQKKGGARGWEKAPYFCFSATTAITGAADGLSPWSVPVRRRRRSSWRRARQRAAHLFALGISRNEILLLPSYLVDSYSLRRRPWPRGKISKRRPPLSSPLFGYVLKKKEEWKAADQHSE